MKQKLFTFSIICLLTSLGTAATVTHPVELELDKEWKLQLRVIGEQIDNRRSYYGRISPEDVYNEQAMILQSDKTPVDLVIRRTAALIDYFEQVHAMTLNEERRVLAELEAEAKNQPAAKMTYYEPEKKDERTPYRLGNVENLEELYPLFAKAKQLQRQVSLKNPLLDFDQLVFVTRFPTSYGHMCDEWYGRVSEPGGGLYILNNPFSDNATVVDLISGNSVQKGEMAGQALKPGAFVTPEVDYDGETIYFAYSGNQRSFLEWSKSEEYNKRKDYFHSPETAYHLFSIKPDGSDLTMLTAGTWNDFYPAVLPNGRIAFLSERRGGEGRCHPRPCPSYVMHSMLPDGSDIVPISYHEINEWSPVVTNDGRIIYSRWDYVDRSFSKGQHPWISNPDGRNVRALYGNYEGGGGSVQADLRPVPESPLFFGTMYGHHSASWGTLTVYDSNIVDNGKENAWKFLTPEIPSYNRDAHRGAFTTPYPLSEQFFLCAYSPDATHFSLLGRSPYEKPQTPHGIYLMDAYGNKTLLYRDEKVPANLPYPLRARKRPPVIPDGTPIAPAPGEPKKEQIGDEATVMVMDVTKSQLPFPADRKPTSLRIIQVLPKTTPFNGSPAIAYDKEYVARQVLGTVPIEEDGSVHFKIPARKPVFLQALDEKGMAIQSMRSSLYAMPEETMSCIGCHEPKEQTPGYQDTINMAPLAMQRKASTITPGPEGSLPFNFARLVQPVLDANCVDCHLENPEKAPDLRADGKLFARLKTLEKERRVNYTDRQWSASYQNLGPYAFVYHTRGNRMADGSKDPGNGFRSIPGEVGAYASPLMGILTTGVHKEKMQLTSDEWEKLITWLDMGSPFFGAYENLKEQQNGEAVFVDLE